MLHFRCLQEQTGLFIFGLQSKYISLGKLLAYKSFSQLSFDHAESKISFDQILYIQRQAEMQVINEQETIKSKLHSFDIEETQYQSAQLSETLRNNRRPLPKYHSFREISDWTDRYHISQSPLPQRSQQNLQQANISFELHKFAFLVSAKHRHNGLLAVSAEQKKEKLCLSPIKMQFASYRAKNSYKKEHEIFKRIEEDSPNKSFYELNYESLNKLYRQKIEGKRQNHEARIQQLPVLFPHKASSVTFPKTERISSIVRIMKRNQQIRGLQRKDKVQNDIFVIPA